MYSDKPWLSNKLVHICGQFTCPIQGQMERKVNVLTWSLYCFKKATSELQAVFGVKESSVPGLEYERVKRFQATKLRFFIEKQD